MTRRLSLILLCLLLAACGTSSAALPSPAPSTPTSSPASPAPPASPSPSPSLADQLGTGGLPPDEEIGAVMMVGFQRPLTASLVSDWPQRQFGGLLVIN